MVCSWFCGGFLEKNSDFLECPLVSWQLHNNKKIQKAIALGHKRILSLFFLFLINTTAVNRKYISQNIKLFL